MSARVSAISCCLTLILSLFLSLSLPAVAVVGGAAETAKLAELITEAKKRLKQLKEHAEEFKVMNDSLNKAKDFLQNIKTEYEYVSGFDPEGELQDLFEEFKEFEELYSIKELLEEEGDYDRIDILLDELDKRIVGSDENKGHEVNQEHLKNLEKKRKALIKLKKHYAEYALSGKNKNLSAKDLALINASASSVLAADVMEKKQKEVEEQIRQQLNRIYELEIQQDMLLFFKSTERSLP